MTFMRKFRANNYLYRFSFCLLLFGSCAQPIWAMDASPDQSSQQNLPNGQEGKNGPPTEPKDNTVAGLNDRLDALEETLKSGQIDNFDHAWQEIQDLEQAKNQLSASSNTQDSKDIPTAEELKKLTSRIDNLKKDIAELHATHLLERCAAIEATADMLSRYSRGGKHARATKKGKGTTSNTSGRAKSQYWEVDEFTRGSIQQPTKCT